VDTWHGERPWPASTLPPGTREEDLFHHEKPDVSLSFAKHEALVIAGLVAGLLILGLVLALIVNGLTGIGGLLLIPLLAVYAAVLAAPAWTAAIADDAEEFAHDHEAEEK
jgi:hypothetical protein